MKDDKIEEVLFSYFSGQLTEEEEKELLNWLSADEANKKILSEMAEWWAISHVPQFMNQGGNIRKQPVTRRLFLIGSKVAAAILILLIVGVSSYYIGKGVQSENAVLAYYEAEVPFGSQTKVVLPDESVVWLNAGSSLKFADNTMENKREVLLSGEGYFEVAHNPDKPFVVKAGDMDIKVLGTSFNIKAYDDEQIIDVALLTGKVDVSLHNVREENSKAELVPNQMLSFNKETKDVHIAMVHSSDYCSWKDGKLKFVEQSFERIAKDLERKYNVTINIKSKYLKNEIFSGSFSYRHALTDIFKEVDVDKKYKWTQMGATFIIEDK